MDRAIAYLQWIHEAVIAVSADGTQDTEEITKKVAILLGLPHKAVSPLLARTFAVNTRVRDLPFLAV
jgi:hypothetical protein